MDSIVYLGTIIEYKQDHRANGRWFGFVILRKSKADNDWETLLYAPHLHAGFKTRGEAREFFFELAKAQLDGQEVQ